jgi:UDP-N-acetylmuramyl pentapeptide phosphotransferase/UDP-N-acetylglucosamine-1-phosphate transferase
MKSLDSAATLQFSQMVLDTIEANTLAVALAFLASLVVGLMVLALQSVFSRGKQLPVMQIQTAHTRHAQRIGGLAIIAGSVTGFAASGLGWTDGTGLFLTASMPFGLIGLLEDFTARLSARMRLWATMVSAAVAVIVCGALLKRSDMWPLDLLLSIPLLAAFFSIFAISGLRHAINIIDGHHGQAAFTCFFAVLGLSSIAYAASDLQLLTLMAVTLASLTGFMLINWPFGRLFMGDGGAYFLGALLAMFSIFTLQHNPTVTPIAVLLISAFPVTEVLFSMWRRRKSRKPMDRPDRLHLHSLLRRRWVRPMLPVAWRGCANPITGLICGTATLPCVILALLTLQNPFGALIALILMVQLYLMVYARLVRFHWCAPWNLMARSGRAIAHR